MMGMMSGGNQIQTLIEETAKEKNVNSIAIVNEEGTILAHSEASKVGQTIAGGQFSTDKKREKIVEESVRADSAGLRTYELVASFSPVTGSGATNMGRMMRQHLSERWMNWCRMMSPGSLPPTSMLCSVYEWISTIGLECRT